MWRKDPFNARDFLASLRFVELGAESVNLKDVLDRLLRLEYEGGQAQEQEKSRASGWNHFWKKIRRRR